jgi:NAD-dependent dihydropyrimidine dehydrogenase PreA subunit
MVPFFENTKVGCPAAWNYAVLGYEGLKFLQFAAGIEIAAVRSMAYVITDTCTKDELCVQACPVDCIHPKQDEGGFAEAPQLFVKPDDCIDCGACVPVCPTNSIFSLDELPEEFAKFADLNAAHYN